MKRKLIVLTLSVMSSIAVVQAGWEALPPLPEANGGFMAGSFDNGIVIAGGTNWERDEKRWFQTLRRLNAQKMQWEVIGELSEPVAYGLCDRWRGSNGKRETLIILGGTNGKRPVKATAVVKVSGTVLQPAPDLPETIVLSAGGIIDGAFIIAGGTDDAANLAGFTNRAFAFDLAKRTVSSLPDVPAKPFSMAAYAVAGRQLYVFGGANYDEKLTNTDASYSFSLENKEWRKLKPYPIAMRGAAAVALDEHRIYIGGGYGGNPEEFFSTAFIYDTRTDSYAKAVSLPYPALVGLVKAHGFVYCIGGEDKQKHRTDAAFRIALTELTAD